MFEVVSIITLGYLKNKHHFNYIRSTATRVLYLVYVLLTVYLDIIM